MNYTGPIREFTTPPEVRAEPERYLEPAAYTDAAYLTIMRDEAWRLADHWRGRSSTDVSNCTYMAFACNTLLDAVAGNDVDAEEARDELDHALRRDRNNILGMIEQKLKQARRTT